LQPPEEIASWQIAQLFVEVVIFSSAVVICAVVGITATGSEKLEGKVNVTVAVFVLVILVPLF
jgi:hypothetical protein